MPLGPVQVMSVKQIQQTHLRGGLCLKAMGANSDGRERPCAGLPTSTRRPSEGPWCFLSQLLMPGGRRPGGR